jgi:F0F1-type ATP synthase membrane subunit b/b'
VLAQRNEEFSSLEEMIEGYQNRAQQNEKDIEESTIQTRKEGYMEKEHFKGQGLQEGKGMLLEASSSVEEKIGKAQKEIEAKMTDVRKALGDEAAAFSKELAEKILGRSV